VDTAFGGLLPSVSLSASVAHARDSSSTIDETDTAEVTANVSVPLYQSGAQHSAVRQARQVNSQRRIQIEENRRQVVESVVQSWEQLQTARARIVSRREQVRANEIALDGVIQEAAVGSRTTLDILDAEQELLDARVALVQAERDEYVAAYSLRSSIGQLTAQKLGLEGEVYDPTEHYRRVRDKWFGTTAE
jgi:outer membrane protein TolC